VFAKTNKQHLLLLIDYMRKVLEPLIGNAKPQKLGKLPNPKTMLRSTSLLQLIDNPFISMLMRFNPISILADAAKESFKDHNLDQEFSMPNFGQITERFLEIVTNAFSSEGKTLLTCFYNIWDEVKHVSMDFDGIMAALLNALKHVAHAALDSIKIVASAVFDFIEEMLNLLTECLVGVWKIPFLTSAFELHAEQEFSLLNFFSFFAARALGIYYGDDKVAEMFDLNPLVDEWTKILEKDSLITLFLGQSVISTDAMPSATFASQLSFQESSANSLRIDAKTASFSAFSIPSASFETQALKSATSSTIQMQYTTNEKYASGYLPEHDPLCKNSKFLALSTDAKVSHNSETKKYKRILIFEK